MPLWVWNSCVHKCSGTLRLCFYPTHIPWMVGLAIEWSDQLMDY